MIDEKNSKNGKYFIYSIVFIVFLFLAIICKTFYNSNNNGRTVISSDSEILNSIPKFCLKEIKKTNNDWLLCCVNESDGSFYICNNKDVFELDDIVSIVYNIQKMANRTSVEYFYACVKEEPPIKYSRRRVQKKISKSDIPVIYALDKEREFAYSFYCSDKWNSDDTHFILNFGYIPFMERNDGAFYREYLYIIPVNETENMGLSKLLNLSFIYDPIVKVEKRVVIPPDYSE